MDQTEVRPAGQIPVVGFVKDPTGVAALYLGKQEGKELVYMGRWGRDGPHRLRQNPQTARHSGQP